MEQGDSRKIIVRDFDPGRDLDAAYRCLVSGFYHNIWPLVDHVEPRFIMDNITMTAAIGGPALVAEVDGEARGLLIGFFPREGLSGARALWQSLYLCLKVLARRYEMTAFGRAAFWRHMQGELAYVTQGVKSRAEILLLTSQKEYRGGIGRALVDAWVEEVRSRGYSNTTVGTDSTLSWEFYERYGFRRVKEFPLKMYFHSLPGVDVHGYYYELDL